jgi:hypothetical protein
MKVLILASMIIIFISIFFIFMIFDTIILTQIGCLSGIGTCNLTGLSFSFIFGLLVIAVFIIVDIMVVYILIKTITARKSTRFVLK